MNNREVCEYVKTLKEKEYIADICVNKGYGQTYGGYLASYSKDDSKLVHPSQQQHFLNYYSNKKNIDKMPAYYFLRCPELLLFIAEIAGVPYIRLLDAYKTLKTYEDSHNLKKTEKNGNYMWGKQEFKTFKSQLQITPLVRIIRNAKNWEIVKEEASKL